MLQRRSEPSGEPCCLHPDILICVLDPYAPPQCNIEGMNEELHLWFTQIDIVTSRDHSNAQIPLKFPACLQGCLFGACLLLHVEGPVFLSCQDTDGVRCLR